MSVTVAGFQLNHRELFVVAKCGSCDFRCREYGGL